MGFKRTGVTKRISEIAVLNPKWSENDIHTQLREEGFVCGTDYKRSTVRTQMKLVRHVQAVQRRSGNNVAMPEQPKPVAGAGTVLEIKMPDGRKVKTSGKHAKFTEVLQTISAKVPVMLVGPTGSGKTYLANQIAQALGVPFTFNSMSAGVTESSILGRLMPTESGEWTYRESPFVTSFRDGGLHLFDEVDAADSNLMVIINSAIANGLLSIPFLEGAPIEQDKDAYLLCAANTFGTGADRMYVGRNQLDAATLDRYAVTTIEVDYDRDLERKIAESFLTPGAADGLLQWAWKTRDRINATMLRRTMSTRSIENAAKLISAGQEFADVKRRYLAGWTRDEIAKVS